MRHLPSYNPLSRQTALTSKSKLLSSPRNSARTSLAVSPSVRRRTARCIACCSRGRRVWRRHETQSFLLWPHCSRGRQSRLRHRSRAAGGGQRRPLPAGEAFRGHLAGEACSRLIRQFPGRTWCVGDRERRLPRGRLRFLAERGDRGPVGGRADEDLEMSSGSISAFPPRFRVNAPVKTLTRKSSSWSS